MSAAGPASEPDASATSDGVAIIGMAGRFPGAPDVRTLWARICEGRSGLTRFSEDELCDAFTPAERADADFVPVRGVLDGVDQFDAGAFRMRPREAALTDPQHRIFLEVAWEALEDGGYPPLAGHGRAVGVFAGCSHNTYLMRHVCGDAAASDRFTSDFQVGSYDALIGGIADALATRVSYKLDLRGPSMTLATACSTSLVATAQAVQALLLHQCEMALAGGVSMTLPQERGYLAQEGGIVSTDGVCRPFDAAANGTVFGAGAGAVLLKRLEDALRDGDHVYAVIRGAAVNNDGASKMGFAAPSVDAQADVIATAHALAGVAPESIGYVECHGTATPLGDPIEVAALARAFGAGRGPERCLIGSVKGLVGHLDAAAGVTGLIVAALAVERGTVPGTGNFRSPNPLLDLDATPFAVADGSSAWPAIPGPRRAGVSGLGVGGTNVHVVLEEAPRRVAAEAGRDERDELLVLSARTAASLDGAAVALAAEFEARPDLALVDVAHTLRTGRTGFEHRAAFVCRDRDGAVAALRGSGPIRGRAAGPTPVVFMFPGQGTQRPGMARELHAQEPVVRDILDAGLAGLPHAVGREVEAFLLGPGEGASSAPTPTRVAQPAIFLTAYALARLWIARGIEPTAMLGHSVGEIVAAAVSGIMTFEDALGFVADRGQLMDGLPGGAMLAVRLPEAELRAHLSAGLDVAAVNAPRLCVAAGPFPAVEELERRLASLGIPHRRLQTSHAFHSAMMDPALPALAARAGRMRLSAPGIACVSGLTGNWIPDDEACSPAYWARHCRESVRFADALRTATRDEEAILLEIGPGRTLATFAAATLPAGTARAVVSSMRDPADPRPDGAVLAEALGRLWVAGATPDWTAAAPAWGRRVSLPPTPFDRQRHWIDAPARPSADRTMPPSEPLLSAADECSTMPAPIADRPSLAEHAAVSAELVDMIEELSGTRLDAATLDRSFVEHGLDSLFLAQFVTQIRKTFGVKLTFRQLLGEHPSVQAVAAHIAALRPEQAPLPAQAPGPAPAASVGPSSLRASAPAAPIMDAQFFGGAALGAETGLQAVFRDQLAAMQQLIAQQCSLLGAAGPAAPPIAPVSSVAAAPAPRPVPATSTDEEGAGRHRIYAPSAGPAGEIGPVQARFVADLVARYNARTPGSKRRAQQHRAVLADPRTAAGFRPEWKELVYPLVCVEAKGSRIRDVDGNDYVDLVNGFGQTAFGHAPDFVVDAIARQLEAGFAIGPQSPIAGEVAELVAELTGCERVTFCNTGSEAVMAAMRVARTVTGRDRVVTFAGDYHGQFDEVLVKAPGRSGTIGALPVAPGIPRESVGNMVVLPYLAPESLAWIRDHADEIAAVVVEPVQSRHPGVEPGPFLRELRAVTEKGEIALVFDEVITGFRVHPGGMQALLGIRADLATYGKVVGGGMPIGILAGTARFMDALDGGQWQFGDASVPEVAPTFFAGTFVRHPLTLAAVKAVLLHLKERGPGLQVELSGRTGRLVERLNGELASRGIAARIKRWGSWYHMDFSRQDRLSSLLFPTMRLLGIHVLESFPCFVTTAHTDGDLARIGDAFAEALDLLQAAGILAPAGVGTVATVADVRPAAAEPLPAWVPPTEAQREVWLAAQQGDEPSCAFNESISLRLEGNLDADALAGALRDVCARHDTLRARFSRDGERMVVEDAVDLEPSRVDLSESATAEADFAALIEEDARTPFDLVRGPLVRAVLVRLSSTEHVLVLTAHHIVCDGWSFNVIVGELGACYAARRENRPHGLPDPVSFRRHAMAEAGRPRDAVPDFWRREYATLPEPLELPTDRPRPVARSFAGATFTGAIEAGATRRLKAAAAREGCTLFSVLLAATQVLFGRLSGQGDVVLAVPSAGQSELDDGALVGHCVNFLPVRAAYDRHEPFRDHLRRVKRTTLDAFEHGDTTLGTIVRCLDVPRTLDRLPLTSLQFNLERLNDRLDFGDLRARFAANPKSFVNYDIFLNVAESQEGLRLDCDYATALFDEATIARWLTHLSTLLDAIADDMATPIAALPLLSAAEERRLAIDLNAGPDVATDGRTLPDLVAAQARLAPDAPALSGDGAAWSYRELDRRADEIAVLVAALVPAAGGRIALATRRSPDMVAAMLGIMRAGHAFVPLDPAQPASRSRKVMEAAAAKLLVCDGPEEGELAPEGVPVLRLDERRPSDGSVMPAPAIAGGDRRPAYVMFTSGSTGEPKGVEIEHRSVVNLLRSVAVEPGFAATDTLLAVTTTTFDISVLELFLPLVTGGRLVIADRDEVRSGFGLVSRIERSGATVMQATPSLWRMLLEAGFRPRPGLRMLCGGEPLPRDLADRLLEGGGDLWNLYGPTETTIWSSVGRVRPGSGPIDIGGPVANTGLYVLDADDRLVPPGVPGELFIGGAGLARGYVGRPDATAAAFREIDVPGLGMRRLYRTGDLARRGPDGSIALLGRADQQIKLRGFRIELGEIEAVLRGVPGLTDCAVGLLRRDEATAGLVGYYVDRDGTLKPADLAAHAAAHLPDYMVPGLWQRLDALPLTANGKLDRKRLPEPEPAVAADRVVTLPRTAREETIAAVWRSVLRLDQVGVDDNIFSLGADSIHVFRIAARLLDQDIRLEAKHLLRYPTIAELASVPDDDAEEGGPPPRAAMPSLRAFRRPRGAQNGAAR